MEWEWPGSNRKIIEKWPSIGQAMGSNRKIIEKWPSIGQAMGKKWKRNSWEMEKKFKMGYEFKCKIYK